MEQEWQNGAGALTAQAIPQKDVEQACFHALGLVGRNCEYLEQHLARVGSPFSVVERMFKAFERTFNVVERTFNDKTTPAVHSPARDVHHHNPPYYSG